MGLSSGYYFMLFSSVSPYLKTFKLLIFGDYKRERGIIAVISKHTGRWEEELYFVHLQLFSSHVE